MLSKASKVTLREAIPEKKVFFLHEDDDLTKEGFTRLASLGVYSMPVKDAKDEKVVGMLDIADFSRLVVQIFTSGSEKSLTVRDCINLSGRDKLVLLKDSASLQEALSQLVQQKLHRLCVVSSKNNDVVVSMLSQLDVVDWFATRLPPSLAKRPISQLGSRKHLGFSSPTSQLVVAHGEDSVLHAVQLLDRHAITAVPVVQGEGSHLVGQISLKDVPRALDHLFESCQQFCKRGTDTRGDVACVDGSTTFGQLLTGFSVTRLHRFWLVEEEKLVGVVSLTDVCRSLLTSLKKESKKK